MREERNTNNDLISRKWLTDAIRNRRTYLSYEDAKDVIDLIDNAPTVIPEKAKEGEYVDISKLRLMTVEECAGHTIEYAMGWKACIEWIKKGGAENENN